MLVKESQPKLIASSVRFYQLRTYVEPACTQSLPVSRAFVKRSLSWSSLPLERLYRIEHPRLVSQFDQLCDGEQEDPGFWISKQWLKGDLSDLVTQRLQFTHVLRLEAGEAQNACPCTG
jgi:hypothetical protein